MAGSVLTAIGVVVAFLSGGLHDFHLRGHTSPTGAVADQLIYTTRTANDAAITLPTVVHDDLRQAGMAHQSIELTRVGYTGNVSTSSIDMTPRTGNTVLKVPGRADPVVDAKISSIEAAVNSPADATGNRELYTGLIRTDFTGAPLTIISSGLDLANPADFRALMWSVPPAQVVTDVKRVGALPALHGPVIFVLVPTAGPQPQLEQTQKNYLKGVWTALLKAAGATSVRFIDASTTAGSAAPSAPTVAIPALPTTPIPQVHTGGESVTCTVPDSYFVFDKANLTDSPKTVRDLTACITAALDAHATFALDGWTSYEGPLNASGKPRFDYTYNRSLSGQRVAAVANLLVNDFHVPQADITRTTGHGNIDQPYPDPRSAANRVVVITYTTK